MRKCIPVLMLAFIYATSYSQQTPAATQQHDYDYYKKKSQKQSIAGWTLITAGTAGLVATLMNDVGESIGDIVITTYFPAVEEPEKPSSAGYYVASGVALVAGLVILSNALQNKQKASALQTSFKMEQAPLLYSNGFGSKSYPSVSLKVGL